MDCPISYASRQLNSVERNYTTTERNGLGVIYSVNKFRYYPLANMFTFFVDHKPLLYLVNKACNPRRIVRWFIILLEFDFTIVVKKGTMHQRQTICLASCMVNLQRALMMICKMLIYSMLK